MKKFKYVILFVSLLVTVVLVYWLCQKKRQEFIELRNTQGYKYETKYNKDSLPVLIKIKPETKYTMYLDLELSQEDIIELSLKDYSKLPIRTVYGMIDYPWYYRILENDRLVDEYLIYKKGDKLYKIKIKSIGEVHVSWGIP